MSEILTQIIELFKSDPQTIWNAILAMLGVSTATVLSVIAVIKSAVSIYGILFKSKNKLKKQIHEIVSGIVEPLESSFTTTNSSMYSMVVEEFSSQMKKIKGDYKKINSQLTDLSSKLEAFATTVLDSEQLKLEYEVLQKELFIINERINAVEDTQMVETIENSTQISTTAEETIVIDKEPIKSETPVKIDLTQSVKKEETKEDIVYV